MSREILAGLEEAGIGIASGTYEIVGLPPVRVVMEPAEKQGKVPGAPDPEGIS
jgi:hypothetical protein